MSQKGKLVRLIGKDQVKVFEEELPEVKDDGILMEVGLGGICGTDIHIIQNADRKEFKDRLPMTLGHEVTGIISKIGKKANESTMCDVPLKKGDKIVIYVFLPCNNCWWDRKFGVDHTLICENPRPGYISHSEKWPYFVGGWGEYMYVQPGTWIWKIPEDVPFEVAVLTEPFSMGIRAVEKALSLPAWKNMQTMSFGGVTVVLGSGAIGILTAIAAKIAGVGKVVLSGGPKKTLQIAQDIGAADEVIDIFETTPEERIEKVKKISQGGYGADVVFEAAGVPNAFLEGLEMTRRLGTFVELGCLIDDGRTVPLNVAKHIVRKDIALYGVASQPPHHFAKSLRSMEAFGGRFDFGRIATSKFPIEKIQDAISLARDPHNKGIKIALAGKAYK